MKSTKVRRSGSACDRFDTGERFESMNFAHVIASNILVMLKQLWFCVVDYRPAERSRWRRRKDIRFFVSRWRVTAATCN